MNLVNSKLRNKINLELLPAFLMVRFSLSNCETYFCTYQLPFEVLEDTGTMAAYQKKSAEDEALISFYQLGL